MCVYTCVYVYNIYYIYTVSPLDSKLQLVNFQRYEGSFSCPVTYGESHACIIYSVLHCSGLYGVR